MEAPTTLGKTEVCIASAYFPGDVENISPSSVAMFANYSKKINTKFINGSDTNAHHIMWGSTDINKRGVGFLNYISSYVL